MRYTIDNRPGRIDFGATGMARTVQNAKNLLLCRMGEVPFDRGRGFDPKKYHRNLELFQAGLMEEIDRVLLWEPDAEAVSADASIDESGEIYIRVEIEVTDE